MDTLCRGMASVRVSLLCGVLAHMRQEGNLRGMAEVLSVLVHAVYHHPVDVLSVRSRPCVFAGHVTARRSTQLLAPELVSDSAHAKPW